jgi:predicted dehydrogenase
MQNRRMFFKASAAALAASRSGSGANDKIQMAIIGTGNRGGRVFDSLARHADCRFLAAAEVNKARLDGWMTPERANWKLQTYGDYRKILDRKDIDAVLIATPDHWHSQITIDAISAGKDVYVEKPVSNTTPRINAMLDACKKGKQVVQVGTHQRSWDHFIEAKKVLDAGTLGNITHVVIVQPGSYARPRECPRSRRRPGWIGTCGRGRRPGRRSSPADWVFARGTTTAADLWPIGARITSIV